MRHLRSPYNPIHIPLGFIIWSLWFVALYGGLSVACEVAAPPAEAAQWTWLNALLLAGTLAIVVLLAALTHGFWRASQRARQRPKERFVAWTAAGVNAIAALACVFIALPILSMPPCL
ncbi:hypothetical protein SAMN05216600_101410 [Pseudomonas cuatrocienegasensis]|uniref:Fumarate reductase subunit C n=1 Tax=Pseudomonas cuatrocienegasensis TaxID=543360 RepID=A0ABY1B1V2_9PSED|nr:MULTISPECIES: hypothetical protein [Pseudomonas]OEC36433.1 hypothetical protein A7D25_04585 [Pseudomonas sp. 21C1]SEP71961.1 hypothetical protein SAMN05216600_101410 [Pseudomonas cuatrocienegasensis]